MRARSVRVSSNPPTIITKEHATSMCGIAGMIDLAGTRPVPHGVLESMAQAIVHRGPDDEGFFRRPGVGLANRRLSIVGLSDGKQPITNESGDLVMVLNGELFEYPEVRAQLQAKGHAFRTHCDAEIVPHLWEEHGEQALQHIRGQFAFALWEERARRLFLARDRFGICPLFWTRRDDWLLFASEIKALLASGLVEPRAEPRGINHAFTFFANPGPITCFEGIYALLPGHYLTIALEGDRDAQLIRDRIYWEIDFPDQGSEEDPGDTKKLVDGFEEVMLRAVERRLRADVPVVSYLSGGVDSSLVVALAGHIRKQPIPTFTISIQDPGLNEEREADVVARHVGSPPVVVPFDRRDVLQSYPDLIRAAETPVIDTACAALLSLAREVHQRGYKVALTGEGADEWLAGYPWYRIQRALEMLDSMPFLKPGKWLRKTFFRLIGVPRFPDEYQQRLLQAIGGDNAWLDPYGLMSMSKLFFFSEDMMKLALAEVPYADLGLNLERARRWHPLNRSLYIGARVMLPGLLLSNKGDRVAMNSSVETRYPFLDEDVFAFLARLAPRWKLRGLREKEILRHLAQRWLPREIAWRRKAMFRAPFDGFHMEQTPPFVEQLLSEESLRKTGYFKVDAVVHWRKAFRELRRNSYQRTSIEMGLVGVAATQLWHHLYIDGCLADLPSVTKKPLALHG